MDADSFLQEELATLRAAGALRSLRVLRGTAEPTVEVGGRRVLMFCSNNYLGLASDTHVVEAAAQAVAEQGAGATGSRLISGNSHLYEALEHELALFKGTEASLVFPSGYHANIGTIPALVGSGDVIFSDELNHASIIDGCRLSRANVCIFRHRDIEHLEELLRSRKGRRMLVITESIFSMDGDLAPLKAIASLSSQYGAMLMVDEAHGTGVAGENGAGIVQALGLTSQVHVQMGTFSKALGSLGGYVAGSRKLVEFLLNRARSLIFTTGLPPAVLAASRAAIELVQHEPFRRETLHQHASKLRSVLATMGFVVASTESQIVPVMIGDARQTMSACRFLLRNGVFVQGIRPPTVPEGTSRLRLTPMATHSSEQLISVLHVFERLAQLQSRRKALCV